MCSLSKQTLPLVDGDSIIGGLNLVPSKFSGVVSPGLIVLPLLIFPPLFYVNQISTMFLPLELQFSFEGCHLQLQLVFAGGQFGQPISEIVIGERLGRKERY